VVKVLTEAAVRKMKAGAKRRAIRDGGARSLYLLIQPRTGFKTWAMFFRGPSGKPQKLTLGPYDPTGHRIDGEPSIGEPLTLVAARRLASLIQHDRATGKFDVARPRTTFAAAARSFVEDHAKTRTRRWEETARTLGLTPDSSIVRGGLAERWAGRDLGSISSGDVHGIVEQTRRKGVPGTVARNTSASDPRGRSMARTLSKFFAWSVQQRLVSSNPCRDVQAPPPPRARDRVLSLDEIAMLWRATEADTPYNAIVRLLLLTGCRLNEIALLRWDEISASGDAINLSGDRTKNHRPHVVPLSDEARTVIGSRPRIAGCDYVFTTRPPAPISGWSKFKKSLDATLPGVAAWRLHDLRRTVATGMAEMGAAPHVVVAALNHVSGAKAGVAGTYNRAAYLTERRQALEAWAERVMEAAR
jgi:integrase